MSDQSSTEAPATAQEDQPAASVEDVAAPPVVMIVDADASDRALYRALVETPAGASRAVSVIEADGIDAAVEAAIVAESLTLFIIGMDAATADASLGLRDALVERFGKGLQGAFCSGDDVSAYLDQFGGSMVFYKPVDDAVMSAWLDEQLGAAEPELAAEDEIAEDEIAEDEIAEDEIAEDEIAEDEIAEDEIAEDEIAEDEIAEDEIAEDEIAEDEIAEDEAAALALAIEADPGEGTPESSRDDDPDLLPEGTELGDYRITRLLRHDDITAMYVAEQRSVNRSVALKALHHRHRTDPERVGSFVDEARARALVSHADVAMVFQADQKKGITYYAIELMSGPSLAQLAEEGAAVDEDTLFDALGSVADIILYLKESGLSVVPIQAATIHLLDREGCRIANPVTGSGPFTLDETAQMKALMEAILPFLQRNSPLMPLVLRLGATDRADGILDAEALTGALDDLESAEVPEPKTPEQVERSADQRSMMVGGIIGGLIVVGGLLFMLLSGPDAKTARTFDYMVPVPEGSFRYQDAEDLELPRFWIDEYEVTIGQYAEFLAANDADPEELKKYQHADQPKSKDTHKPPKWDSYYPAAQRGGNFGGAPISLDCPVIQVDWWDAHAYATWRGGRLPTEQEWEKAARSRSGNIYPWGNELDTKLFNSGVDQKADGDVAAGSVDGFQYWSPVDALAGDESRYGVRGMAGNVSEWTGSWETDPDFPDRKVPIIRGASFNSADNFDLKRRVTAESADTATLWTGFRIVRDTPPPEPETAVAEN